MGDDWWMKEKATTKKIVLDIIDPKILLIWSVYGHGIQLLLLYIYLR